LAEVVAREVQSSEHESHPRALLDAFRDRLLETLLPFIGTKEHRARDRMGDPYPRIVGLELEGEPMRAHRVEPTPFALEVHGALREREPFPSRACQLLLDLVIEGMLGKRAIDRLDELRLGLPLRSVENVRELGEASDGCGILLEREDEGARRIVLPPLSSERASVLELREHERLPACEPRPQVLLAERHGALRPAEPGLHSR